MDVHCQVTMMTNHPGQLKCLAILFFLIPAVTALSFDFTSFSANSTDIVYQGTTQLASNYIQLTSGVPQSVARAMYAQPLRLWDRASGNLTAFTTHFSFVIDSSNMTNYGDGITFLLVPQGAAFPERVVGGSLGLTGMLWNSTEIRLVAVEFDIYGNEYVDPPYEHIGLDVNAVSSVASVRWLGASSSIMEGRPQEAFISYDSQSRNMTVVLTSSRDGSSVTQSLSHVVDLREYLPEFVNFGFSASTGGGAAMQNIYSWSFSSTLEAN